VRRPTLIGLLAAAVAPAPAAADTVAHRTPAVGPKIAGAQTIWGEERDEGVRVMVGAPRAQPRALYRLPDSGARKTERGFFHTPWSLSASPTHVGAIVHTGTVTSQGSDFVGTTSTAAAVGGPLGAVTALSGRTPRRGDSPCSGTSESPEAVAVDGARIATAELAYECDVPGSGRPRIAVRDGDVVQVVTIESEVHVLQLAGRYVARVQDAGRRQELVVLDLATGVEVLRESRFAIGDIDLDADGTVALTYAQGPRGRRVGVMRVGAPGLRELDRNVADRGVALAGGRVLYEKRDRGDFRSRLLLRELGGGVRRLARFTPRRRRVGDLDLSADRAVWAAQKTRSADYEAKPSGPARIVSRPL
jgi:hypothetical protein